MLIPALFVSALFYFQFNQAPPDKIWRHQGEIMGTTYMIQVVHKQSIDLQKYHSILEQVNQSMSTYLDTSELSQLNRSDGSKVIPISAQLRQVLHTSLDVSKASNGAFDVTVGPLVNAWGFGPTHLTKSPSPKIINELRNKIGYQKISLTDQGVHKKRSDLYIDLSAIAKGYAVDQVAAALTSDQLTRFWVEVGGEIRTQGTNADGDPWRVGVEQPNYTGGRSIHKIIPLSNMSIATSGDYRNQYLDQNGVLRSHTIDPRTGKPIEHNLASVSVLATEAMHADAWATTLNVLGPEEGMRVANERQLKVIMLVRMSAITQDSPPPKMEERMSDAMRTYLDSYQ